MRLKTYSDIFPLTIIQMKYGGKYVAFNCETNDFIGDAQELEEPMYDTKSYIEKKYFGAYGIGDTIWEALDKLIIKYNQEI